MNSLRESLGKYAQCFLFLFLRGLNLFPGAGGTNSSSSAGSTGTGVPSWLKAGGVGINLTAADYVIHVDPWWNPAVEDQASDRAHRIGQTRPVTVYRLVTMGTIEEKVMSLHASKRHLAQQLLSNQVEKNLSAQDLMSLLTD